MISFLINSGEKIQIPPEYVDEVKKMRKQTAYIRVSISPVYEKRTRDQNAYFHAKVNEISAQLGTDRNVIKNLIKQKAIDMGYPCEKDELGNLIIENNHPVALSSAKVSIEQMEILIEALYIWCSENGIIIEEE